MSNDADGKECSTSVAVPMTDTDNRGDYSAKCVPTMDTAAVATTAVLGYSGVGDSASGIVSRKERGLHELALLTTTAASTKNAGSTVACGISISLGSSSLGGLTRGKQKRKTVQVFQGKSDG